MTGIIIGIIALPIVVAVIVLAILWVWPRERKQTVFMSHNEGDR